MVKSDNHKSFVKIGSRLQIGLFFLFYQNFQPTRPFIPTAPTPPPAYLILPNVPDLKPATLLKVTLLHGCFSRFLNCTNGTKLRKTYFVSIVLEISKLETW